MTKAANESDADALRNQLKVGLDGILMTLLPASVVLFLIAPYVCVILFARGASSLSESLATAQLVQVFCFGLIPFSIFYLLLRIFYAKENTSTPFFLNLGLNLITLIGALITYQVLPVQDRVTGLVASLVIAYVITTALTLIVTRRVTRGLGLVHLAKTAAKSLLTSAVVGMVCLISLESIEPEVGLNMAQNLIALAVSLVAATGAVLLVWRLLGIRKLSFFQAN
jgi:putative peptidoglycan lipid II flippase